MKLLPLVSRFAVITVGVLCAAGCQAAQQENGANPTPVAAQSGRAGTRTTPAPGDSIAPVRSHVPIPVEIQPSISPAELKVTLKADGGEANPLVVPIQFQPAVTAPGTITIPIEVRVHVEREEAHEDGGTGESLRKDDFIGHMNSGDLLTLLVILATYVATVRFFLTERLEKVNIVLKPEEAAAAARDKQKRMRRNLNLLIPADILLVAAALLLTWRLFGALFAGITGVEVLIAGLFLLTVVFLAVRHGWEWCKGLYKMWERRKENRKKKKADVSAPPAKDVPKA